MNYTIDASVFVVMARVTEPHHLASLDFLTALQTSGADVFCPALILAEASAAITRRTGDTVAAMNLVALIKNFAGMNLVAVAEALAERAAQIAADCRLRGADAVYVATAEEFTTTLVTWDGNMLQRGAAVVATMTPEDWLQAQSSASP